MNVVSEVCSLPTLSPYNLYTDFTLYGTELDR